MYWIYIIKWREDIDVNIKIIIELIKRVKVYKKSGSELDSLIYPG